jgi:hypothetical protein
VEFQPFHAGGAFQHRVCGDRFVAPGKRLQIDDLYRRSRAGRFRISGAANLSITDQLRMAAVSQNVIGFLESPLSETEKQRAVTSAARARGAWERLNLLNGLTREAGNSRRPRRALRAGAKIRRLRSAPARERDRGAAQAARKPALAQDRRRFGSP